MKLCSKAISHRGCFIKK